MFFSSFSASLWVHALRFVQALPFARLRARAPAGLIQHQAHRLLVALLLASLQGRAQAQDITGGLGAPAAPQPGTRLERVDISARQQSDTDLRRKAAVAKQVYGREEMDRYGDTNVADVLKRLPGINMQGNSPRMRGLGAGYTLLLINGDPAPPGFALDQLSPTQIERIEVTKGPTADQSAQAVAGTINIIMKDAPRVSQRDLRLGVGYAAERPAVNGTFTLGEKIGAAAVSLPISFFEWRNENKFVNDRFMPGLDGKSARAVQAAVQPVWGHGVNMGPRVNWRISDDESVSLQSFIQKGYFNNTQAFTNTVVSGLPSLDDDSETHGTWQNLRGNLVWVNRFNDSQRLELKAGAQQSKNSFNNQTFRFGNSQRSAVGNNEDDSVSQAGKFGQLLGDEHSATAGWDLEWRQRDEKRSVVELGVPQLPEYEGQPFGARIVRQAFFVQDEWEISPQWSTYLGLRNERITTTSTSGAASNSQPAAAVTNTSSVLTPLWHLNYKFDAKGRDMIRASLTRSYKAPDLSGLLARPSLSGLFTNTNTSNNELSPDRVGNPLLKPELATGLDVSFEKYLVGGGLISVGVFYRDVNNLIRSAITLERPSYASVPRWVSRPINFSTAQTAGLELEVKGRAGELMPSLVDPKLALNLRGSLNFYRSQVEALSGPNNRLDGQQPWSGNFGADHRFADMPLTVGGSLAFTPGYTTQQTQSQSLEQSRSRSLDLFAQWIVSKTLSMRLSANNFIPLDTQAQTLVQGGYFTNTNRSSRTQYGLGLEIKL